MENLENKPLRIAILGTRGIPARYGGFETFAEELSARLALRGHHVTVYGRRFFGAQGPVPETSCRGAFVRLIPTFRHKYLETVVHAGLSFLDLLFRPADVVLLCNAANAPFAWLGRLRGIPVIINVDGIERRRSKWNRLGKLWYRVGEMTSVCFASRLVADAQVIADYYQDSYRAGSEIIAYGADEICAPPGKVLETYALRPGQYLLYVSRLEPENNALGVIKACRGLNTSLPLVVVGDAPYAADYIKALKAAAGPNVIFTGYQFGAAYRELRSNCYLYIQASEVGGTHPALVEAMAAGNCVVANAVPEHLEVLGGAGVYYWRNDFDDLKRRLEFLLANPETVRHYGKAAKARARAKFNWDTITLQYEKLFYRVSRGA